ncbi:MAG: PilT/PilU family type 4a pilus ATPase [Deltaproteobacteria bacterium]|nr:PilT/PilU family type 4a pilus ATPase [Deltaproteobacteria bacterium]MBW1746886.1 PilT/PilU family type 4a pilus ATPase [Deltaproteobacteria bacterium]MBW1825425.1 PilT/PilU family type 4a pilus ATPase [Deltaproteobacteria bacterium]MBW1967875.1 PilT/PilU family type 4a pilus ATPase [Deltaproteobacteria bacterium]MBW2155388.1 PilT/PilU family type 4a pilus ATPase [Deltaproteobacteria bacterium]
MKKQEIDHILARMLDTYDNVSDLNITVGKPFQVETSGELAVVDMDPPFHEITPFQAEIFALNLINQNRRLTENLLLEGSCDSSYELPGKARFRTNIFSQRGNYSIVLRKLATKIPTCQELGIPGSFLEMAEEKNGIVLITGATGCGKSTSLAAILNEINDAKSVHVVTLEDPVEFDHPHKKSTFNQREMGEDFDTFSGGLRAALRQAPKVILVGEMRDRVTLDIALSAAETGHLVLSTLHTVDAGQTVNRIIGMFPPEEENQIRTRLADVVRWIVCQRLLPKVGGGRIAAFEIMRTNLRVKDTILHGESEGKTFYEIIQAGEAFGMSTFDDYIVGLYEQDVITQETAMAYSSRKGEVGRGIDAIKSVRGEATTDIEDLKVDHEYGKGLKK